MAKPVRKRQKRPSTETRSIEALTVGWMLMVLTALVCELGFVLARWLSGGETESSWAVLMALMLFSSTIIGVFVLMLTPVVIKSRREPPPRGVIVFSVIVGAAPLAIIVLQLMSG